MSSGNSLYAPSLRSDQETIERQTRMIDDSGYLKDIFKAMSEVAAILNSNRQIVYSNDALLSLLPEDDRKEIFGKRPGEAINCIHCKEMPGGCGASESCRYCGAVNTIIRSQESGERVQEECRIVSFIEDEEVSFDFRVTATPLQIGKEKFTMLSMLDISSEKRRIALERIFFHDIINTAGGIQGFIGFLSEVEDTATMKNYVKVADQLSHDLIDEIQAQRALVMAENSELTINVGEATPEDLIEEVKQTVQYHNVADNKKINIDLTHGRNKLLTDRTLFKRVLINMLKNALEATEAEGEVSIGYVSSGEGVTFHVHNDQYMTRDVQLQVFKRSFSTRGSDRGLGTYSIKLLAEKFLDGSVWFESDEINGTTFYVQVPFALKTPGDNID
jgi:signal transduction histidine kinase